MNQGGPDPAKWDDNFEEIDDLVHFASEDMMETDEKLESIEMEHSRETLHASEEEVVALWGENVCWAGTVSTVIGGRSVHLAGTVLVRTLSCCASVPLTYQRLFVSHRACAKPTTPVDSLKGGRRRWTPLGGVVYHHSSALLDIIIRQADRKYLRDVS